MSGYPPSRGDWSYRAPYPRHDGSRSYRDPYEERVLDDLARANDPYAARDQDSVTGSDRDRERDRDRDQDRDRARARASDLDRDLDRDGDRSSYRRRYQPSPPPIVTVTAPREEQRRSITPLERRGPYGSFARYSETPPPRGSRWTVDRFDDTFGDVPESSKSSHHVLQDVLESNANTGGRTSDRLRYSPPGPPRDPFTSYSSVGDRPYGGGPPPRNPYVPGGEFYDEPGSSRRRHRSLDEDLEQYEERHRREHEHQRSNMGESWGLAEYQDYQDRLRRRYSSPRPGSF